MPEACVDITKAQVGHVVGSGGSTTKAIQERTGTKLEVIQDGPTVKITGETDEQVALAVAEVKKIVANQENPDYEGPVGARLRREANALGDKRGRLFDEATAKRNAGDHAAANELVKEGKKAGEDMLARHHAAAAAIAEHNNEAKGRGEDYFDMHGLREGEAMEMLQARVAVLEARPAGTVTEMEVIPGAGHHSSPGAQKLKSAAEAFFKERQFTYEAVSAGSFMVRVPGGGAPAEERPKAEEAAKPSASQAPAAAAEEPQSLVVMIAMPEDVRRSEEERHATGPSVRIFVPMPAVIRERHSRSQETDQRSAPPLQESDTSMTEGSDGTRMDELAPISQLSTLTHDTTAVTDTTCCDTQVPAGPSALPDVRSGPHTPVSDHPTAHEDGEVLSAEGSKNVNSPTTAVNPAKEKAKGCCCAMV